MTGVRGGVSSPEHYRSDCCASVAYPAGSHAVSSEELGRRQGMRGVAYCADTLYE